MNARAAEIRNAVRSLCDLHRASVFFELTRGGHWRATIEHNGRKAVVFFAGTPSDVRAIRNTTSWARRALRSMAVEVRP